MSSLQSGSRWSRTQLPARILLAVPAAVLLCLSCTTTPRVQGETFSSLPTYFPPQSTWGGHVTGSRSQFNQSCGAACAAPVNVGTGEILAPTATRAGRVLEKVVKIAQGLNTLNRALDGAELDLVEATLKACVAQAHADVNDAYQRRKDGFRFENGKFPNDAECKKVVRFDEAGDEVSLAQELGLLKHAAAFACIKARLPEGLRENFTIEPRYKPDPEVNGVVLTNKGLDTLHPDFVVHGTRNATDVQCVYEFKFPCFSAHRLDPRSSPGVEDQLKAYQKLTKRCPAALIAPVGLLQLGIP